MATHKSKLWSLKSEFRNQKSETRIQKSEISNRNPWKFEIHNWEIRKQKLDFRNATCYIQFWQSRFIPVCDVIISNIESVKSSAFPLRGWVESFWYYFRCRFSKRGKGEYFLTSCVNNFSGKWEKQGWGEVNVGWQFPASFRKYSVALVYCDKMSTIASLGTKEEIKRQQIKLSDSELWRILKQMDDHILYGIFHCNFI